MFDRKLYNILLLFKLVVLLGVLIGYGECYKVGNNPNKRAAILGPQGRYRVEWEVDRRGTGRINFNVTVWTNGWVLFGFANDGGEQTGRDVVVGGVRENGEAYFSDRHTGRFNERLRLDNNQHYTLESSSEIGIYTFLSFSRDLDTCDSQDYPITENKVTLVWAYGQDDDENGETAPVNQGTYDVYLLDPEFSPRVIRENLYDQVPRITGRESANIQIWTIRKSSLISRNDTTYQCSIHKAPELQRKHHVIGFDVNFLDETSRNHTHHIIVHRCLAPRGFSTRSLFEPFAQSGEEQSCFTVNRPSTGSMPYHFCTRVYAVWALGGREFFTPDHVGMPFGEDEEEYYLFQVHYDNPSQRSGIRVNINMDFFYTRRLRPNEGGIIAIGHAVPGLPESLLIPPKTENLRIFGHCSQECTRRMLPKEGITLVAGFLHSHTSGRQLRLHHFRGNEELPWILYDDNYSNEYQQVRALPRGETQIYPGDQVTMDCTYDNTWMNGTVVGGFRTSQEMCLAYMVYYNLLPDYSGCSSSPVSPKFRQRFLGITNTTWYQSRIDWVAEGSSPSFLRGRTVTDISDDEIEWDREAREELEQFHLQHPHVGSCARDVHARNVEDVEEWLEGGGEENGELVISGDVMTRVDNGNAYSGPVSYPYSNIGYTIAPNRCLQRGLVYKRKV